MEKEIKKKKRQILEKSIGKSSEKLMGHLYLNVTRLVTCFI